MPDIFIQAFCTVIGKVRKIHGRRQMGIGNPAASIYPVYVDTYKCYFSTCSRVTHAHSVHKSEIIHYVPTDCRIRQIYTISSTDYPGYGLSRSIVSLLCQVSRLDNVWKKRRTRITRCRETSKATDLKFGTLVYMDNFSKMHE